VYVYIDASKVFIKQQTKKKGAGPILDYINVEDTENTNNGHIFEVNNNFFNKYNPMIRKIVARILDNSGQSRDIDDCVSEVFLAIMEKLQKYNETRGSMAAFVAIIARSVALNYCRDNTRQTDELIGDDKIDFISGPLGFENEVEFDMLVESIFAKLNEKESVLFTMKYLLFYKSDEIAKVFKITRTAVDVRVNRLKSKIKKILAKGGIMI